MECDCRSLNELVEFLRLEHSTRSKQEPQDQRDGSCVRRAVGGSRLETDVIL